MSSNQSTDSMLKEALTADVSFLVVGDPFGATTHSDLMIRAAQMGVKTQVSMQVVEYNMSDSKRL